MSELGVLKPKEASVHAVLAELMANKDDIAQIVVVVKNKQGDSNVLTFSTLGELSFAILILQDYALKVMQHGCDNGSK